MVYFLQGLRGVHDNFYLPFFILIYWAFVFTSACSNLRESPKRFKYVIKSGFYLLYSYCFEFWDERTARRRAIIFHAISLILLLCLITIVIFPSTDIGSPFELPKYDAQYIVKVSRFNDRWYTLPGDISRDPERDCYVVHRVYWPNGGYLTFDGEIEMMPDKEAVVLDQHGDEWQIILTTQKARADTSTPSPRWFDVLSAVGYALSAVSCVLALIKCIISISRSYSSCLGSANHKRPAHPCTSIGDGPLLKTGKDCILMEQMQNKQRDEAATLLELAATRKAMEQEAQTPQPVPEPSPNPPAPAQAVICTDQPVDAPPQRRDKRFQIAIATLSVVLALSVAANLYQWSSSQIVPAQLQSLQNELAAERSRKNELVNETASLNAQVTKYMFENIDLRDELRNYELGVALLNSYSEYYQQYHTYACDKINSQGHYIVSTNYAEDTLQCTPCPLCH